MHLWKTSVLALALVGSAAFATIVPGTYVGGGVWSTPDGQNGKWTTTMNVAKAERGYTVTEKLSVYAPGAKPDAQPMHTEETTWRGVGTGNGFFDVYVGDGKSGWGYCNPHSCHVEGKGKAKGSSYGETFLFGPKGVYRTGFDKGETEVVAWEGGMVRKP